MEEQKEKRPLGIKIICILGWLEAVIILLAGLALVFLGTLETSLIGNLIGTNIFGMPMEAGGIVGLIAEISAVLGIVLAILGAVSFLVTYWLWKMTKRGWKWAMYSQVSTLLLGIISLVLDPTAILEMIIPVIIIIYLWFKKDLFK